jgi:dTDP-glucose pyrophosphorylase
MHDVALVMPMAGRGSRFRQGGTLIPKPLVELWGRPLFWWATESVLRAVRVREMVFVVLAKHIERAGIETSIREFYPNARIVAIPDVTAGAAETAAIGATALHTRGPFAVNDCDHAFLGRHVAQLIGQLQGSTEGALLGFRASSPAYSYVRFDARGAVEGTVEKVVASDYAIAGCYLFSDPQTFLERFAAYRAACTYDELFVSGVYNAMLRAGAEVLFRELERHVAFGTPEEHARIARDDLAFLAPRAT